MFLLFLPLLFADTGKLALGGNYSQNCSDYIAYDWINRSDGTALGNLCGGESWVEYYQDTVIKEGMFYMYQKEKIYFQKKLDEVTTKNYTIDLVTRQDRDFYVYLYNGAGETAPAVWIYGHRVTGDVCNGGLFLYENDQASYSCGTQYDLTNLQDTTFLFRAVATLTSPTGGSMNVTVYNVTVVDGETVLIELDSISNLVTTTDTEINTIFLRHKQNVAGNISEIAVYNGTERPPAPSEGEPPPPPPEEEGDMHCRNWSVMNTSTGTSLFSVDCTGTAQIYNSLGVGATPSATLTVVTGGTTIADEWTVRSDPDIKYEVQHYDVPDKKLPNVYTAKIGTEVPDWGWVNYPEEEEQCYIHYDNFSKEPVENKICENVVIDHWRYEIVGYKLILSEERITMMADEVKEITGYGLDDKVGVYGYVSYLTSYITKLEKRIEELEEQIQQ